MFKFLKMDTKKQYIIFAVIMIALAAFGFVMIYSLLLVESGIGSREEPKPVIDEYDQEFEFDIGIAGDGYNERPIYTKEQYEADRKQIIKNIRRGSYDFVLDKAQQLLAKYQFSDLELLKNILALEDILIFAPDSESSTEDKIIAISSFNDPEIYMHLFLTLSLSEQSMLITKDNINAIPKYDYTDISFEKTSTVFGDILFDEVGSCEYYKFTLTCKYTKIVVCMKYEHSLEIFYVNNIEGTLNGTKY